MNIIRKAKDKIGKTKDRIKEIYNKHFEDILIFGGFLIILLTTFSLNIYIGSYLLGIMLVMLGIFLIKFPRR